MYAPWDLPGPLFCAVFVPHPARLLLIMETEWWPNMLHYCARSGVACCC